MAPRFLIKQMGSEAILLRGPGLRAGDDECKLGRAQFELLEGLLRTGKCQRGWARLDFWREFCVGGTDLGSQVYVVIELGEDELSSSMKPALLPPVDCTQP